MRATTSRKALLETLGKVKSAVSRSSLPISNSVLIRSGGGQVTATGHSLDFCLTTSCKAAVSQVGAVCTPPKELETFLKAVNAEKVILYSVGNSSLKVEAGKTSTALHGFDAKDFPPIPGIKGKGVEVSGLGKALKEVSYAVSKDEARPAFNGVCFTPVNSSIEMAATDGYRLGVTRVKTKGTLARQVIIPSAVITLIEKLMSGKVSIHQTPNETSFIGDGLVLTTKPVNSTYPAYNHVIPKNGSPLTFSRTEMETALKVVTAVNPGSAVRLQTRAGMLTLQTIEMDRGVVEARIPARGKVKVAFNGNYLKDLLKRLEEKVTLRIKDAQSPGVVRVNGTIYVLMPRNVAW